MKKEAKRRTLAFVRGAGMVTRGFRPGHLIVLFPFFALLLEYGVIVPFEILLFLLAFAFAIAAGYTYNTICDAEKDPEAKNPITRGALSKGRAFLVLALSLSLAIILFVFASRSVVAILLFGVYLCIWLAYSGLGIRLKESIFGPAAASIVLWSGPPLLLLVSFSYFSLSTTLLLFGLFTLYIGHEIKHTLIEHDLDVSHNCKTFAVILGKKRAAIAEYVTLTVGSVFLLAGAYYAPNSNTAIIALFAAAFTISIILTAIYGARRNYDLQRDVTFITLPYVVTKMFLITYGFVVLLFPPILIFFVLWFYLMKPYP
jgi:4-hydroxybenzoate polyprenyltransferase